MLLCAVVLSRKILWRKNRTNDFGNICCGCLWTVVKKKNYSVLKRVSRYWTCLRTLRTHQEKNPQSREHHNNYVRATCRLFLRSSYDACTKAIHIPIFSVVRKQPLNEIGVIIRCVSIIFCGELNGYFTNFVKRLSEMTQKSINNVRLPYEHSRTTYENYYVRRFVCVKAHTWFIKLFLPSSHSVFR